MQKQIRLYEVDTDAFFTNGELDVYREKKQLVKQRNELNRSDPVLDKKLRSQIKQAEKDLRKSLNVDEHPGRVRELRRDALYYISKDGNERCRLDNQHSMAQSALTRAMGVEAGQLTYDIFVMKVFFYDILRNLIQNGFDYNGEHYVFFSASAGQIRHKKCMFVLISPQMTESRSAWMRMRSDRFYPSQNQVEFSIITQ